MPDYFKNNMALFQGGGLSGANTLAAYPTTTSIMFYPKGPSGNGYVDAGDGGWPFVAANLDTKEDAAFILGELCDLVDPGWPDRFEDFNQTGDSFKNGFTNIPADADIFNDMLTKYAIQYTGVVTGLYDATTAQIVSRCLFGGEPASTVVDSLRPRIEAVLSENWNN
jgi:hypothetical protein